MCILRSDYVICAGYSKTAWYVQALLRLRVYAGCTQTTWFVHAVVRLHSMWMRGMCRQYSDYVV